MSPLCTTPSAPVVGLSEAARISGVSVATVRRRKDALVEYGATSTPEGWRIPIPALVAVGLLDRVSPPDTPARSALTAAMAPPDDAALVILREEVETHRRGRVAAEHRAELAEAVADERGRALADHRMAMRAITAGPSTPPAPAAQALAPGGHPQQPVTLELRTSKYLNTAEVAQELHLAAATVRYWRQVGKGPKSFKLGRRVLYAVEDLEVFIAAARAGGPAGLVSPPDTPATFALAPTTAPPDDTVLVAISL